ncbi:hypothetical protein SPHINGOAX6_50437 [Sphingomonas sp. AX6]|nr:hypothetical protein SPHINGOAX6_50437 [Sphingomonas sp. AX6]
MPAFGDRVGISPSDRMVEAPGGRVTQDDEVPWLTGGFMHGNAPAKDDGSTPMHDADRLAITGLIAARG